MAISGTHYRLLKSIQPILPQGGSLLEIGEANWYGDIGFEEFSEEYVSMVDKMTGADAAVGNLNLSQMLGGNLFAIAKACYATLFNPRRIVSVDANGSPAALRQDLNGPLDICGHSDKSKTCPLNDPETFCNPVTAGLECTCPQERFDICINHGTAEHVFNIAQVFRTMHDACCTYGLMIHESPFTGWIDHGFYCLQPTLFYDLAAANGYEVALVAIEHIESGTIIRLEGRDHVAKLAEAGQLPNNAMLFVVFKKLFDAEFRIPAQGYYARALSESGMKSWGTMR